MQRRTWLAAAASVGVALMLTGSAGADPPAHVPGGPCIEESRRSAFRARRHLTAPMRPCPVDPCEAPVPGSAGG